MRTILSRSICLILTVALMLSLSGCFFFDDGGIDDVWVETRGGSSDVDVDATDSAPVQNGSDAEIGYTTDSAGNYVINRFLYSTSAAYAPVAPTYSYDNLQTEDQRTIYRAILDSAYTVSDTPDDTDADGLYPIKTAVLTGKEYKFSDISVAQEAVLDDHPEIFWMAKYIAYTWDGDDTTEILTYSLYPPGTIITKMTGIESAVVSFLSSLSAGMSAYEREIYIHDYLADLCTYDKDIDSSDNYDDKHPEIGRIDGVLINRKAVCEGYSRAAAFLMRKVGVECVCVCGVGENERHMWNCVKLDGDWYGLDLTWDDSDDAVIYDYCNINDDVMRDDHRYDKLYSALSESAITSAEPYNTFVPPCTATAYTYYLREFPHLTDVNSDELKEALYATASSGESVCTLYVDPSRYTAQQALDLLFDSSPQIYYENVNEVNEQLTSRTIDTDSTSYIINEKRNLLKFYLTYV